MHTEILDNGNLAVVLDADDDRDEVLSWCNGNDWERMFESEFSNGWGGVLPEWIGALTDAPILTDDLEWPEDGQSHPVPRGHIWWFPNYTVEDPIETLATKGRVVFQRGS